MATNDTANKPRVLTEVESKDMLGKAGVPVVQTKLARDEKEALALSREAGYPVVLKVMSEDVVHKSDAGGVKLGLEDEAQVSRAYAEMMSSVKAPRLSSTVCGSQLKSPRSATSSTIRWATFRMISKSSRTESGSLTV